jgi:hypothetical protein
MKRLRECDTIERKRRPNKKAPEDLWKGLPYDAWFVVFEFLQVRREPRSFIKDMSRFSCACRSFREAALRYTPWKIVLDIRATMLTGSSDPYWYMRLYRFAIGPGKTAKAVANASKKLKYLVNVPNGVYFAMEESVREYQAGIPPD